VGEASALRQLVPLLTPHVDVFISVTTDTGIARARSLYGDESACHVVRYPLDFSWSVRRFMEAVRPDAVGLVELELWPNFIGQCRRRNVPVCVVNGRLSERSFRGYRRFRPVLGGMFRRLAFAAVQDDAYAERFRAMGAEPVHVTGSMKWDSAMIEDDVPGSWELAEAMGIDLDRPLIVAGSTGPGEDALLHAACPAGVQLLCAPRKPERFDEAADAMPGCVRRTECTGTEAATPRGSDRFLLDTIGELRQAYALADVVVVGRSFGDLYGSDPIEPIALGKPVVIGPAVGDFERIVEAFRDAAGLVQTTRDGLASVLGQLLEDLDRRSALAARGRDVIRQHQGASRRHAELLLDLAGLTVKL
jgi:3-deoxy-D-manno-octulosonic-acid transferase